MNIDQLNSAKELRLYRKNALARTLEREISQEAPTEMLMFEWSKKADILIDKALKLVIAEIDSPPEFTIIALGKLGGLELNYSSDVDLIYIFEGDFEKASKIAHRFTKLLSEVTEDGFVFRVDNNLRPRGKDGHLVNTIDALERYYEIEAHEWERQALIRARFVAGNRAIGDGFINRVRPYVYRRSLDVGALKKIRASKLALERTAEDEGWRNIKLGPGGIRELEFIVQAMQLLNGGKFEELRTTNTFEALALLLKHKLISKNKHDDLIDAYRLLRRTENVLQGLQDRQIHVIPKAKDEVEALAKILSFSSGAELVDKLDTYRKLVQRYFSELFETSYEKLEIADEFQANLETCHNWEEIIDSIPWFKNHISKRIQELDMADKLSLDDVSERLTFLAETIVQEALNAGMHKISKAYGTPRTAEGISAGIAVLGMGKLGTFEMDYGSDLDLIFIYSGDGETDGAKKITNHEFFTRVAQTALSVITLPTRYGRAYNIDMELRPSGNQGVLVSSVEAFERYHLREASLWERQALLRSRPVAGDAGLKSGLAILLEQLIFERPLPHDTAEQILALRKRSIEAHKPLSGKIDIKFSAGGLADIESIVHFLQLTHGVKDKKLRLKKLAAALHQLQIAKFISDDEFIALNRAGGLYRQLISRSRLFKASSLSMIDCSDEQFEGIATSLKFKDKATLKNELQHLMKETRNIFLKYLATR